MAITAFAEYYVSGWRPALFDNHSWPAQRVALEYMDHAVCEDDDGSIWWDEDGQIHAVGEVITDEHSGRVRLQAGFKGPGEGGFTQPSDGGLTWLVRDRGAGGEHESRADEHDARAHQARQAMPCR